MYKTIHVMLLVMIFVSCKQKREPIFSAVTAEIDTIYRASAEGKSKVYYATFTLCNENNIDIYVVANAIASVDIGDTDPRSLKTMDEWYDRLDKNGDFYFISKFYYQGYDSIPDSNRFNITVTQCYRLGSKSKDVIRAGIVLPEEFLKVNSAYLDKTGKYCKIGARSCIKINVVLKDSWNRRSLSLFYKYVTENAMPTSGAGLYINFKFTDDDREILHNIFYDIRSPMIDKLILHPQED